MATVSSGSTNSLEFFQLNLEFLTAAATAAAAAAASCFVIIRALGDQWNGDGQNHMEYREQVVKYIREHRDDFEPFMEDDRGFDDYVRHLSHDGVYAGHWYGRI